MTKALELLNIYVTSPVLRKRAELFCNDKVFSLIKIRSSIIKELARSCKNNAYQLVTSNQFTQTINKYKKHVYHPTDEVVFSNKELKTLIYSLDFKDEEYESILNNKLEINTLLNILDKRWKNSFLFGLFDCLIKIWANKLKYTYFEILHNYLMRKLSNYSGNNSVIKSIVDNSPYFNSLSGDVILGADLAAKNIAIASVCNFLNLPDSRISYSYFSRTIDAYFEKTQIIDENTVDELEKVLVIHNNLITTKRTLSKIIIRVEVNNYDPPKNGLKNLVFKLIGDPEINSNWSILYSSDPSDLQNIQRAQAIVNEWITKEFILVFFEKCIRDVRRKEFWLKYSKSIKQFKIVGGHYIKHLLMSDQRLSNLIDSRFISAIYQANRNSAIIFVISDHILVEFSNSGAFYSFKFNNSLAPKLDIREIHSVDSIKTNQMRALFHRNGEYMSDMRDEGRQSHRDGDLRWETAFEFWLDKVLDVRP